MNGVWVVKGKSFNSYEAAYDYCMNEEVRINIGEIRFYGKA